MLSDTMPGNRITRITMSTMMTTQGIEPIRMSELLIEGGAWTVIFFFASAAASSAYLTVSKTFPLEIHALAIAMFYAVGTGHRRPWRFSDAGRPSARHRPSMASIRKPSQ